MYWALSYATWIPMSQSIGWELPVTSLKMERQGQADVRGQTKLQLIKTCHLGIRVAEASCGRHHQSWSLGKPLCSIFCDVEVNSMLWYHEAKLKSQRQNHILVNGSVVIPGERTRKILIVESFSKELNVDWGNTELRCLLKMFCHVPLFPHYTNSMKFVWIRKNFQNNNYTPPSNYCLL